MHPQPCVRAVIIHDIVYQVLHGPPNVVLKRSEEDEREVFLKAYSWLDRADWLVRDIPLRERDEVCQDASYHTKLEVSLFDFVHGRIEEAKKGFTEALALAQAYEDERRIVQARYILQKISEDETHLRTLDAAGLTEYAFLP